MRDELLHNFYMVKEASRLEHDTELLQMSKKAAVENFYMVKEAVDPLSGAFIGGSGVVGYLAGKGLQRVKRKVKKKIQRTLTQTSKSRGSGVGKGRAALLLAGGLGAGLLASEAYRRYKRS